MPGTTSDDWTNSVPLNSIEKAVTSDVKGKMDLIGKCKMDM
jgi:hypothetical protein